MDFIKETDIKFFGETIINTEKYNNIKLLGIGIKIRRYFRPLIFDLK